MSESTVEVEDKVEKKPNKPKQRSYFSAHKLRRYLLDDNESYIEHKPLDEGLYESYQDLTSSIKLDREGETTEVDMALGKTRRFLLENLVEGWNLVDEEGQPISYAPKKLLELPPHVIGGLVEDIYNKNPILRGDSEEGKETSKD